MPKNNKKEMKSLSSVERCIECECGFKIEYLGEDKKGKLLMKLHNKVCTVQVMGTYEVVQQNRLEHRTFH